MTSVVPASKTFTSSSGSIHGSFYITASALLEGFFYVVLNTTGTNALDYSTTSSYFQLLKSSSPLPAPNLLSCQFSDSGGFVYISFDSATDKGVSSIVNALTASNPVTPGPVLLVPKTISSCTNVTVDATLSSGSGGRDWQSVDWKVDGFTGSADTGDKVAIYPYDVLDVLLAYGVKINHLINIPVKLLQEATYTITLTLINFLGQSSTISASFTVNGNRNMPTLNIVGSAFITVNPSQTVLVYSNAELSSCSQSQNIQYSWTVFTASGVDSGITSVSNDPKVLLLLAHSLSAGTIYQAQVTALVKVGETDNEATALVTIQVVNGPVIAAVKGGYNRAVFITNTSPLTLDASSSTDSNLPVRSASQGLSFQWTCSISSTLRYGEDCSNVFGPQATTLSSVSLSGALVMYGFTYAFAVIVSSSDGRSDSKVVTVQNLMAPPTPTAEGTSAPTFVGAYTSISTGSEPLTTTFALLTTGWSDDPSDYPLTYDFVYAISTALSSIKARTTASGDTSYAIQVVSNAANILNVVNCTGADALACRELGRGACVDVPRTYCSLSVDEVSSRDASRTAMCQTIINVANSSNPSTQLMETLVNTLLVSYSPTEVVSPVGTVLCQQALAYIAAYAKNGLLVGASSTTSAYLVQTASNFVTQAQSNRSSNGTAPGKDGSAISASVGDIIEGVLLNMVNGQDPIDIVSQNIRMKVLRNAVSTMLLSSLSPPATTSEAAYGAVLPKLQFSDLDLSACDTGGGYVQMSVMAWGNNPFPGSTKVTTPLLRMDATTSGASGRRLDSFTATSRTETLATPPAYFITLQFSEVQNFNFSLDPNTPLPFGSNETFPECRMYNGFAYVPCNGCNISTYNNHNVTHACGTIQELCGGSSGRRLATHANLDVEAADSFQQVSEGRFQSSRALQVISGDDDGSATQAGHTTVSQFGAILHAIEAELIGVLTSFNPFAIDVKKSTPILSVVVRFDSNQAIAFDEQRDKEQYVSDEVATFLNIVMPSDNTVLKKDKKFQFKTALWEKHDYFAMFSS
eukprot:gene26271-biopygen22627